MPNTLATPDWVLREVGRGYVNSVQFVKNVNRQLSDEYTQAGAKVGNTVQYRLPQRWTANLGQALNVQAINDQTVPVTLSNQYNVGFGYSTADQTLSIQDVRERYVNTAADTLASTVDGFAFSAVYADVWNSVGTPGTTPSTQSTYTTAGVKLTDQSTPRPRAAVLDPLAMATISTTVSSLFNPQPTIGEAYTDAMLGRGQLGISAWYEDQNRPVHTTGTFTSSTPLVNGANQTGASLITDGWASGATTLNAGDVFTIDGVYSVNPLSRVSTGRLQQFVVTTTISDTTGAITAAISPSIITSGAYQTVSASPANNAPINVWSSSGTYALSTTVSPVSMVFHKDAFAFVAADLAQNLGGAEVTVVRSNQWGISIRMVQQYQIGTDQNPSRLDVLVGAATLQARMACRVQG